MALPDLNLDDRTADQLFQELRLRIPGYTPEWTDFNDSDPGITLLQLFAWLTELTLFRLNQVPDKNYRKFLELVGITLNQPQPARADLTFTPSEGDAAVTVTVPKGTKVDLTAGGDGDPVTFETDDNLYAVRCKLTGVQAFDGARFARVEPEDRGPGKKFYPFGQRPQAGAALYLGFDHAFPAVGDEMRLHVYLSEGDAIAQGQAVAADAAEVTPPATTVWEYYAGELSDGRAVWGRLDVTADTTVALTTSGEVRFNSPGSDQRPAEVGLFQAPGDVPLFWLRCRVEQELGPGYQAPPLAEDVVLNTISATNAVTQTEELLGASSGRPNQQFRLAKTPVLPGTLMLEVQEDADFEAWTEVPDFAASGPVSKHYTLDLATGTVTFGDGRHGKIPRPKLPEAPKLSTALTTLPPPPLTNIRARSYRWGGGARGNAGANSITALRGSVPGIGAVTNLRPAGGGTDLETIDSARQRAPRELRTGGRAVSADDYEYVATQTPGANVRRAKALPGHHPTFVPRRAGGSGGPEDEVPVPGVVTVLIVPGAPPAVRRPEPTEQALRRVGQFLRSRAPVTTELYVAPPRYRKVEVSARVIAAPRADSGAVSKGLTDLLLSYFHPLTGGDDGTGWEFGQPVYFSSVYRLVLTAPGVLRLANDLTLIVDGVQRQGADARQDVLLRPDEVVYSENHTVSVTYE